MDLQIGRENNNKKYACQFAPSTLCQIVPKYRKRKVIIKV